MKAIADGSKARLIIFVSGKASFLYEKASFLCLKELQFVASLREVSHTEIRKHQAKKLVQKPDFDQRAGTRPLVKTSVTSVFG